jgi:DNA anti-recombination protein RmuC
MADLSKYLRRFRRFVSPPGRPGPAAVPVDRVQEMSGELAEVFQAIDAVEAEAERIRQRGRTETERKQKEAERETERLLSEARDLSDQTRAEEAARRTEDIEREARAALDEAREEADDVRKRSEGKLDAAARSIVDGLLGADAEGPG